MLNLNEALARERVRQLPKPFAFGREEAERISPAFLQEALQHAKPLDMVLNAFSPDPSELYVSAMQEAIRENPDADASLQSGLFFLEQRAIQKLFRHRVDYDLLPEVLVHGMGTLLKAKSRDPEELWKTALARTVSAVNPLCSQPEFLAVETPQKLAKDFLYQSVSGEEIYASFLKQALLQNPELSREDAREAVASGIHQFFSPKGFAFQQVTPALFGALCASYLAKHWKISILPIVLLTVLLLFKGDLQVGVLIPVGVIVSLLGAHLMFKKGWVGQNDNG